MRRIIGLSDKMNPGRPDGWSSLLSSDQSWSVSCSVEGWGVFPLFSLPWVALDSANPARASNVGTRHSRAAPHVLSGVDPPLLSCVISCANSPKVTVWGWVFVGSGVGSVETGRFSTIAGVLGGESGLPHFARSVGVA